MIVRQIALFSLLFLFTIGNAFAEKITNPVAPSGKDPYVTQLGGYYYYIYSLNGKIWVNKSKSLIQVLQYDGKPVWSGTPGTSHSNNIWAPEIFHINGAWYIYFAADDGDNVNHRMFVLKADGADAQGSYTLVGKVSDPSDRWAIDGTVLEHRDQLYFIWSGWDGETNVQQNLYIAKLSDPTRIEGKRVLISSPEYHWELHGTPRVNEGPQVLKSPTGEIFVIYSASGSWTDFYALGQLKLVGEDPMDGKNWKKFPSPVFQGTDKVFSPGHASFVTSTDGDEHWIIYHSARHKGAGWDRDVSIKPYMWQKDGSPLFGKPLEKGVPFDGPSAP